jgi:hypothetical protein
LVRIPAEDRSTEECAAVGGLNASVVTGNAFLRRRNYERQV